MVEPNRAATNDDSARFLLRLPSELRNDIKKLAVEAKISMNAQCLLMLKSYMENIKQEEWENSNEYFDIMLEQFESQQIKSNYKDINALKTLVAQMLNHLRSYIKKQRLWFNSLETQRLTMQIALWKKERNFCPIPY